MYNMYMVLQRDLKGANFGELEQGAMDYPYEPTKFTTEDSHYFGYIGFLGWSFGCWSKSPSVPFIQQWTLVYHRFRDCLVLADIVRYGHASQKGKIDPKWNPDNHQAEGGHPSL